MESTTEVVKAIHRSGRQIVLAITGGGSGAIGELLRVPGGSQSILAAVVPYSWPALVEFLGGKPDQACSAETARAMAMAAWCQARRLATLDGALEQLVGIGCTASLASDRPKQGDHRLFIAVQTLDYTHTYSRILAKGARSREEEERVATELVLAQLAFCCGITGAKYPDKLPGESAVRIDHHCAQAGWVELMGGKTRLVGANGANELAAAGPIAIFPGAFNPCHAGHKQMAEIAAQRLSLPVILEISILNVDKPPLNYTDLFLRTGRLGTSPYFLTRAPNFVEKAELFPGATFVVGADTLTRIAQPKYYHHDVALRDQALATLARGCRFLVFGRKTGEGFQTLSDLELPSRLRSCCEEVPETEFHIDLSSTELRHGAGE